MEMQYMTASLKLEDEKNQELKKFPKERQKEYLNQMDPLFKELLKKCDEDANFEKIFMQGHKSWERCFRYIYEKVREMSNPTDEEKRKARTGERPIMVTATIETVIGWMFDYYYLDDKAEYEKEKKDAEKKAEERKKTREAKTVKAVTKTKPKKPRPKKKSVLEGQESFFDMFN